jgi:hypothetical protein
MATGFPSVEAMMERASRYRLDFPPTADGFTPLKFLRSLVDANDLVFGVLQETGTQPGWVTLKGQAVIDFIDECGVDEELRWTAIPLSCLEEGAALQDTLGLPRTL